MGSGDLLLALVRGVHGGAVLSLFGCLVFAAVIAPAARTGGSDAAALARRLARASGMLALLSGVVWLVAETGIIAGVHTPGAIAGFLPLVTLQTQFGRFLLARLVLLFGLVLLPGRRALRLVALPLAAAAVAVQPMLSHAGATPDPLGAVLLAAEWMHLLAAGAWFGGLLPLWLTVRRLPPDDAALACARFSALATPAVVLILAGGLVLAAALVGSWAGLVATLYGRLVLLKTVLFAGAMGFAGANRFGLTGRLARRGERGALLLSVGLETGIGVAILLAAGALAMQMPGADGSMRHAPHDGMATTIPADRLLARNGRFDSPIDPAGC